MSSPAYLKLIPKMVSDRKKMERKNANSLLRIPVNQQTTLYDIAEHILKKAYPLKSEYTVALYIIADGVVSKLPLTLNTAEFMIMTHQDKEGEIRYSFEDQNAHPPSQQKAPPQPETVFIDPPMAPPVAREQPEYSHTIPENPPVNLAPQPSDLSINLTTGLSMFNSIGIFPQLDSTFNVPPLNETPSQAAKSLKNELESLIKKQ